MALWGNYDSKTASGTLQIYANGQVSGTSTAFTTQAVVGDFISVANTDYMITSIANDTIVQVVGQYQNATVTAQNSGSSYNLSNKPKFTLLDANYNAGDQYATDLYWNYSNNVYGVDSTEENVANGAVRDVVLTFAGSGYTANATATFAGGTGNTVAVAGNAHVTAGKVDSILFSNNGAGFLTPPTVTISAPTAISFNANTAVSNTNATIAISTANTTWSVGDHLVYSVAAGNTVISPLANNGNYYVVFANTTTIALAATKGGANLALVAGLSETGHYLTGDTATAVPFLSGVKHHSHTGWNKRTVGAGGRAGRVYFETLVALSGINGDASDDNVLPDA
jgi:hypothetical protein